MRDQSRRGVLGLGAGALLGVGGAVLASPASVQAAPSADTGAFNVRTYGALGDGVADDTDAIQATIDAILGGKPEQGATAVRYAQAVLYLPPGKYRITRPLKIYSTMGFQFVGAGTELTFLAVSANMATPMDINGCYMGRFSDFSIIGTSPSVQVTNGFQLDWDPAVSKRSTTGVKIERINMRNLNYVNGFAGGVNSLSRQVDDTVYRDCYVNGYWADGERSRYQCGFKIGSGNFGNILSHYIIGGGSAGNRYNVRFDATSASGVYQFDVGHGEVDFFLTSSGFMEIVGVRSENSRRFLDTVTAGYGVEINLRGVLFVASKMQADGRFINMNLPGSLNIDGLVVSGGVNPVIYCGGNSGRITGVNTRGVATRTPPAGLVVSSGPAAPIAVTHAAYAALTSTDVISDVSSLWQSATNSVSHQVKATAGQTAKLQEWLDPTGSVRASVNPGGQFVLTPASGIAVNVATGGARSTSVRLGPAAGYITKECGSMFDNILVACAPAASAVAPLQHGGQMLFGSSYWAGDISHPEFSALMNMRRSAAVNDQYLRCTTDFGSDGDLIAGTAGKGLRVKEGVNARMGTGTLNGATEVTINTTAVTANSRIFLTVQTPHGTATGSLYVSSRVAGRSFGVKGLPGDASDFAWQIVEPA